MATAAGAAALPLVTAGGAAASEAAVPPVVTGPHHPAAEYPPGAGPESHVEPLNASVQCGLSGSESDH